MKESKSGQSFSIISSEGGLLEQRAIPNSSEAEFAFPFSVSTNEIVDLFEAVTLEQKFELIQSEQCYATAIKHGKKSFMQVIDCFNLWTDTNMTAIKMNVNTREKDSKRVCRIRGLVGSRKEVNQFIEKFKLKSQSLSSSKEVIYHTQQQPQMNEQTNPFYLQSCAAYMFHKILSNDKYGLGSILNSSIKDFNESFHDSSKAAEYIPLAMKKALGICEQMVKNLYKDFNYGRHEMEQIMPYCRISVQKYLFQKVNTVIVNLYTTKNVSSNNGFKEKVENILNSLSPATIFENISLNSHFTFLPQDHECYNKKGELRNSLTAQKYEKAVKEFERIVNTHSPREKVKHCQIMYTYLKTIIFEESEGKNELLNMQDIIPILILILLLCKIENIKNEIDIMVDFTGYDPCDLESERRLLVNVSESFNYIWRDWKLE